MRARNSSSITVAKFFALLEGRLNVSIEDLHKAAYPCLRHRILLNFDALADEATTDTLIRQTLIELDTKDKKNAPVQLKDASASKKR